MTVETYTRAEIESAQNDLDTYADWSKFWDSRTGQDTLRIASDMNLQPRSSAADRECYERAVLRGARGEVCPEYSCEDAPLPNGKGVYCVHCGMHGTERDSN